MNDTQSVNSSYETFISQYSHHFLRLVVTLCYLAVGLSVISVPLLVRQSLHGDEKTLGLAMGIYAFTAIPARIFTGIIMRRVGYRFSLICAALLLSVSTLICGLADSISVLIIGRIILGIGTGAMMAVATAWMVELPANATQTGKAIGSVGTINYAVLALSAPVGTALCYWWGAQHTLLLTALFPFCAVLVITRLAVVPIGPAASSKKHAAGKVMLAALVPGFILLLAGIGYAAIVSFGLEIGQSRHLSAGSSLVLVFGITMVVARVLLGDLTNRFSGSMAIALVFLLEITGLMLLSYSQHNLGLWAGSVLIGLAMAFIYPMLGVQVSRIAGSYRGSALSIYGAFINAGIGAGSILIGILSSRWSLSVALSGSALVLVMGIILALSLPILERISQRYFNG